MLQVKQADLQYIENLVGNPTKLIGHADQNDPFLAIYDTASGKEIIIGYNPMSRSRNWKLDVFGIDIITLADFLKKSTVVGQMELFGVQEDECQEYSVIAQENCVAALKQALEALKLMQSNREIRIL